MENWLRDIRYAARVLVRTPAFSLGVVATLALTIGTSTAVFSVASGVLLRPLPFSDPGRLVWVAGIVEPGRRDGPFSLPEFLDYRSQATTLETLVAYGGYSGILSGDAAAERLQGLRLSADAFATLGVTATVGRLLTAADDDPAAPAVAVISYGLWQRRFAADPGVIGQTLRLNGEPFVLVGVLPHPFPLPVRDLDVVIPLVPGRDPWRGVRTSTNFLRMFGRLKPGVSPAQAESELNTIAGELRARYPEPYAADMGVVVTPLHTQLVANYRQSLTLLLAAVVVVLGVALANLSNLFLARALAREKEVAIRLALGASRRTLARQLVAESGLLAAVGGAAGLLLGEAGRRLLVAFGPRDLPRLQETSLDLTVAAFAAGLSAIAGLALALMPLLRHGAAAALRQRATAGPQAARIRAAAVIVEVAMAVLLVVCAALVARSLLTLHDADRGFDPRDTIVARISLPATGYRTRDALLGFATRFGAEVRAIPGVTAVGAVNAAPLSGLLATVKFLIAGRPPLAGRDVPEAQFRVVTEEFFAAMRIPVLAGRAFTDADEGGRDPVAIVNRSLAARFFPDGGAIGAQVLINDSQGGKRPLTIVGVVGDVQQMRVDGEPTFDIYLPLAQAHADTLVWLRNNQFWVVRGQGVTLDAGVRQALARVDPAVGLASIRTGEDYVDAGLHGRRFTTSLLAGFSLSALLIALVGLYAVIAYTVAQRTRELGVRVAIGASRARIVRHVIGGAARLLGSGVAAGLLLASAAASQLQGLLYQTPPHDAATFGATAAVFMAAGLAAAAVPAVRASRVDPTTALKIE